MRNLIFFFLFFYFLTTIFSFTQIISPLNNSIEIDLNQTIQINISGIENTSTFFDWNDESLIAYWNFDLGTTSQSFDISDNSNNVNYYSGANSNNNVGIRGNYSEFDGNNDYVRSGNNLAIFEQTYPISMSFWIHLRGSTSNSFIGHLGQNGDSYSGYNMIITSSGSIISRIGEGGGFCNSGSRRDYAKNSGSLNTNDWNHIVVNYNGLTNRELFINGVEFSFDSNSGSGSFLGFTTNSAFRFGGISDDGCGSSFYSNASFDEIMVFSKSLSQYEVDALYNSQSTNLSYVKNNLNNLTQYNFTVYSTNTSGDFLKSSFFFNTNTSYVLPVIEYQIVNTSSNFPTQGLSSLFLSVLFVLLFLFFN